MGATFTNIHIKKTDTLCREQVEALLSALLEKIGFQRTSDTETADETVILCEVNGSNWITVSSGFFETQGSGILKTLSWQLNTDVMSISCYDSDFINMNLVNAADNTDAWVNVGRPEYEERESNYPEWKNKVSNLDRFIEVTQEDYVFAEDVLNHIEELMGLPCVQSNLYADYPPENSENVTVTTLGFSASRPENNAPPKLSICHQNGMPAIPGESQFFQINNNGGASKGLGIVFVGSYIENDEITFTDCSLEFNSKSMPVELKKIKSVDGSYVLHWRDEDIILPPAPPENLSYSKKEKLEWENRIIFRYTPNGNSRKFLDITICAAPLQNWEKGQAVTNVWRTYGSKKRYIDEHNKFCIETRTSCGFFPDDRIGLIREEDYDLD